MSVLTLMVGAGGTGSYVLPLLLERYEQERVDHKVLVVDGDVLEERNLLRQGFYLDDLGLNKAQALVKHYKNVDLATGVYYSTKNITSISYLVQVVQTMVSFHTDIDEVRLVCCADNTMVRYRLELGLHLILNLPTIKQVIYVDSGNTELRGQVLFHKYSKGDTVISQQGISINGGISDSIFSRIDAPDLASKLTFGDFELSCDVVSESAPQNIATNQLAAFYVVKALMNQRGSYEFNSRTAFGGKLANQTHEVVQAELTSMMQDEVFIREITPNTEQAISINKI